MTSEFFQLTGRVGRIGSIFRKACFLLINWLRVRIPRSHKTILLVRVVLFHAQDHKNNMLVARRAVLEKRAIINNQTAAVWKDNGSVSII